MDINKFHELREKNRQQNKVGKELIKILFDASSKFDSILTRSVELKITLSPDSNPEVTIVDKILWNYKLIEPSRIGDHLFINAVKDLRYSHIAEELVEFVRSIDPISKLVKSESSNKYVNYKVSDGKIYHKDRCNFVCFLPQLDGLQVYVYQGDYSFLEGINVRPDERYPYFKISDSYQTKYAKDLIQL